MTRLVIVCGLSFAGKSTLARALSARLGHREVDVDATKVRLYGPDVEDAALGDDDWRRIYAAADGEIAAHLAEGASVVDGSRNFRRFERDGARRIAARAGVPLVTVYVDTPAEVARARRVRNRAAPTRVDIPDAEFEGLLRLTEPPTADEQPLLFHHADDLDAWIDRHAEALR